MTVLILVDDLKTIVVRLSVNCTILSKNLLFVEEKYFFVTSYKKDVFRNTFIFSYLQRLRIRNIE